MSEERFDAIAQKAIREAQAVECPVEEYIDGLKHIVSEVETEIEAALTFGGEE